MKTTKMNKMKTKKHTNECGIANAALKYKGELPILTESTVRGWLKKYCSQLGAKAPNSQVHSYICKMRKPSLLT